ncbi:beta-lactamase family protein [Thalassotalea sp. 1_MG-2023]|uniref:serine hydrolase n=1 Tax=Thalassotalea sp. 1_MG-2023 TaxID=3062680 RepID=UPI0026E12F50|nr:serine hydrolase [Thalassotalea sp. 1_MG-2023]MDO6427437.1 beta-lactamase family protein [Thalassotalea sp. 1_MG-2023]
MKKLVLGRFAVLFSVLACMQFNVQAVETSALLNFNTIQSSGTHSTKQQAMKINALMNDYHALRELNGSVLVAKNGKIIFEKGFGKANFQWGIKNDPNTKFRIGSLTKQFTATLILQLVEQGKIALNQPISEYLPYYRKDNANKVTIHQLLNHTSGIPNYTRDKDFRDQVSRNPYEVKAFIQKHCSDELAFEPGSQFQYSNSGYFILGAIIESVTGDTYAEVLEQQILSPLKMHDTGYDNGQEILTNKAQGYDKLLEGYQHTSYVDMSIPYAAGSMYSTTRDLLKWDSALYQQTLLKTSSLARMFDDTSGRNYGYGWMIEQLPAEKFGQTKTVVKHGGGINGFNAFITRVIEDKYLVIILNNAGGAPMTAMTEGILNILYNKSVAPAQQHPRYALYQQYKNGGIKALEQHHKSLSQKDESISERQLNSLGYSLISEKRLADAIKIFTFTTRVYPKSANAYDSLAEAYYLDEQFEQAMKFYQTSLSIDKSNDNAKQMIEKISALL